MRKIAAWLHRYLGLGLALLLFVSGGTGALIAFSDELDAGLNPALLQVQPQAHAANLDEIVARTRQALPQAQLAFIAFPEAPDQALEIWLRDSPLRAYADPYSGAILGVRDSHASLMGFLVDLHIHLLSGETGEAVMGWAGLASLPLLLLGVWLWWPRRSRWKQALAVKWDAAPVRVWLDLHKVAGVLACAFLLMIAATGSALALYDVVTEPLLVRLTGAGARQAAPLSSPGQQPAPLEPMLRQAAALFPQGRVTRISLPTRPEGAVMVRVRQPAEAHQYGRTFVWFDQYSGRVLRTDDIFRANLATRIQSWLYPLHTGFYGGLGTRLLQVMLGLALALLAGSGVWLWLANRRARRIAAARREVYGAEVGTPRPVRAERNG